MMIPHPRLLWRRPKLYFLFWLGNLRYWRRLRADRKREKPFYVVCPNCHIPLISREVSGGSILDTELIYGEFQKTENNDEGYVEKLEVGCRRCGVILNLAEGIFNTLDP